MVHAALKLFINPSYCVLIKSVFTIQCNMLECIEMHDIKIFFYAQSQPKLHKIWQIKLITKAYCHT